MISILLGLVMGITHYFSEQFCLKCKYYYAHIMSFSAGISSAYIFIDLFPRFTEGAMQVSRSLFLFILFGFVAFHLVEKYIYQHAPKSKLRRELAIEDSITSFVYHFIIGMIFVIFLRENLFRGILFFIPVFMYTAVSTLPVDPTKSKLVKTILASSTLLGVLFVRYIYTEITPKIYLSLLGIVIGILSYTVIRHSIPPKKQGKPLYLALGVIIYTILIMISWRFI